VKIIIPYHKIEHIYGDYLVKYNGAVWQTKEDIKLFPNTLTLFNPTPLNEFERIVTGFSNILTGGD